jgi:class 3 adenylate cyclase/tetratricopeptide (TPR) repeat protein
MPCPSCGTDNEAGRKFCHECGGRLTLGCASCGAPNTPGAKFCGECGSGIGQTDATVRPAAPTPAAAAERRLVTVLFADLVGFTTISESRDAEDVREMLGRYFDTSREIVERYGGTVEKFIGDAVMAVWGAPVAREDDAERAVRAALDLVDGAQRIGQEAEVSDLALRAGVLTGEAAVTIGATNQGMVAGDLVNTASRLQSVAPPGTVLVGESTQRAAAGAIAFEPAGEQLLKGKEAPVPAFQALRVVAKRGGAGRSDQLEPPFVGREAELRLIKDFYHATARERGVRLVSVLGQAGIGKSRLAWEFLKYVDGLTEDVFWHQGRSPAYGDGISFWALGEMVRMRAGIGEGESEAATRSKLTASLEQFVADAEERRSLEGPLLQLLGVEESRGQGREALFAAWRTFFERIADVSTVALVFEDLQWADEGLLDFIEEMLAWSRGRPIYLITLSRPELLDRRPNWGAGQRAFTSLGLVPLRDEEMHELLNGLVPGLPEAAVRAIVARAEGVPLYAVETVRMLLNSGRVEMVDGSYRPVGDLTELAVPESLHALIAARIDALPAADRTLMQNASVLGLSFTVEALASVAGEVDEEIRSMLRDLVRRELITMEDDPRSPERGQFRFVQGLLREVAYGTLSRRDRRSRHLAAARYYEALGDDELSGILAQHYLDAYHAQPDGPEGEAVARQALITLQGAAQRASGLGSHDRALGYLEQALSVVSEPRLELELHQAAGGAAAFAGRMEAAESHLRAAVELASTLGDDAARRIATAHLANTLLEGHQDQARAILEEALAEPGLEPDTAGFVHLAEIRAKLEMRTGHEKASVEWSDRALPAAEKLGDERLVHELLITRATSLAHLGRPTEAVAALTGTRLICERRSLTDAALRAAINLSYTLNPDDPLASLEVARDGLELARRFGMRIGVRYLLGNAAYGALDAGDWDWVDEQVSEELSQGNLEPAERIWYDSLDISLRAFRGEDVRQRADELWELAVTFEDTQYRGVAMSAVIACALASDRAAEAHPRAQTLAGDMVGWADAAPYHGRLAIWMQSAEETRKSVEAHERARKGRVWAAQHAMLLGALAQLEGRSADARTHYAEALRTYRDLGLLLSLAECQLDIVRLGAMEPAERRAAADEARAFFQRVGATALLERLDDALGRDPALSPTQPSGAARKTGQPAAAE